MGFFTFVVNKLSSIENLEWVETCSSQFTYFTMA